MPAAPQIVLVQNWFEELKRLVRNSVNWRGESARFLRRGIDGTPVNLGRSTLRR